MTKVVFEHEKFQQFRKPTRSTPLIVQLLVTYTGGALNEKQANYMLIGLILLAIPMSVYLFLNATRTPLPPPPDQIIEVAGPGQ